MLTPKKAGNWAHDATLLAIVSVGASALFGAASQPPFPSSIHDLLGITAVQSQLRVTSAHCAIINPADTFLPTRRS